MNENIRVKQKVMNENSQGTKQIDERKQKSENNW